MYMDDIKPFAINEKELETLIKTVTIFSQDIGIEFGIGKSSTLVIKSRKQHMTEAIELPNQEIIRTLVEKENLQIFGNIGSCHHHKYRRKKVYIRRAPKLLETKLYHRNLIKGINTWAVPLVRYSGPFMKWTGEDLK